MDRNRKRRQLRKAVASPVVVPARVDEIAVQVRIHELIGQQQTNQPQIVDLSKTAPCSLFEHAAGGWHVVEPARVFLPNWHQRVICDHLEACTYGQIKKLIINIPPGFMKSLLAAVFWPSWVWTFRPHIRWLFSSYNADFATRDSRRTRDLIKSDWYRSQYGIPFRLSGDQNLKTYFENNKTGYRMAFGTGSGTGARGDISVVDDPHKIDEAESELAKADTIDWWMNTMSLRGNDPKEYVEVVIMQRLDEGDLTGAIIAKELGYEHLCLPMHYSVTHRFANTPARPTRIGFVDPRDRSMGGTGEGALLDPRRFPEPTIKALSKTLTSYGASGQFEQDPIPAGGGMFKRKWFRETRAVPFRALRVRYWDKATEAGWTVGALLAMTTEMIDGLAVPKDFYIEDIKRDQLSFHKREKLIKDTADDDAEMYGEGKVETYVEQEPGSAGVDVARITIRRLAGHRIKRDRPTGDKVTRARPLADQAEDGNVHIKIAPWLEAFLKEAERFPRGEKDQIDAVGGALKKLMLKSRDFRRRHTTHQQLFK